MLPIATPSDLRESLRTHLEDLICEASLDPAVAEAVSSAAVTYLAEQNLHPPLPDDYLHLIIYRALCALHLRDAATRWASTQLPGMAVPIFDPAVWPGPVPLLVWQLFASRLVRPARTITSEGRILWTLDFRRLRKEQAGWLEITLLPGLRALLEQLAPAWDESSGTGLLGLRGLFAVGFAPTPRRRKQKTHSPFAPLDAAAIRTFCNQVLSRFQQTRGWNRTPDIIYVDLPGRN